MKKYKLIIQFLIFGVMIVLSQNKSFAQYVTLEGKQFKLNGSNFNPIMLNYNVEPIKFTSDSSRYISASHTYGDNPCFECLTKPNCDLQMDTDFTRIRRMKFNTIRICGFYPMFSNTDSLLYFHFIPDDCGNSDSIQLNPLNQYDSGMLTILPLYDSILSLASKDTLKVMFIIRGRGSSLGSAEVSEINNFLDRLSSHFASSPYNDALFAYDLMNEPIYSIVPHDSIKTKEQACEITNTWYNTIKTNDTLHLVTLGGSGKSDVISFDPAVLKLDFLTLHYYPEFAIYENRTDTAVQQLMRERSMNELYWMQQNCPIPWMIGETGFSASENHENPLTYYDGLNGTLAEQDSFARVTLQAACNCGASGYAWFAYQDVNFDTLGSPFYGSCFPCLLELYSGYPDSAPNYKPAVQQFKNFTWQVTGNCPVSYNSTYNADKLYYNPNQHPYNPVQGGPIVTGNITDQDGNPIRDAEIVAHTLITQPATTDVHITYSDSLGHFEVIPYDWTPPTPFNGPIVNIKISATGSDVKNYGWYGPPVPTNGTPISCTLNRYDYNYNTQTNGHTVASGTTKYFRGFSTLTASNITIENNAVAEFVAPDGVTINGEFTANAGSDVYIYCANSIPDCDEFPEVNPLDQRKLPAVVQNSSELQVKKEIELGFELPTYSLFVYPNPSKGIFTVESTNTAENESNLLTIFDIYGRKVYSNNIESGYELLDLSSFSKGVYYIQVNNSAQSFNKRIIIN